MAVLLSSVISTVRGIVVDRIDDAVTPFFTDAEISKAVNSTIGGFFGVRPEAFSTGSILTEPPDEISEIGRACLGFTRAGTYADFSDISTAFLGDSLDDGKISLNFKTDRTGGLLFFGDPADVHTALLVETTGLRLINSDDPALDLQLLGDFTDNEWHTVEIALASASVTMTVGSEASTAAYAGSLVADPSTAYLGRVVIGADEYGFKGYMSELVIWGADSRELIRYAMDEGSGSSLFNSSKYDTGLPSVIRIVCTDDAAFSGDYTLNVDRWEMAGGYSVLKTDKWYLSDGVTTYHAPDNGVNIPPATFYTTLDYPLTIEVNEAGSASINGLYSFVGFKDDVDGDGAPVSYPYWEYSTYSLLWNSANFGWGVWTIPSTLYYGTEEDYSPIPTTLIAGYDGDAPAPTLSYTLEATATCSALSATIYADPVEWIADEELDIASWAVQQFCYGVAAFLLMQRGKDSFYRKAADALQKLYIGS